VCLLVMSNAITPQVFEEFGFKILDVWHNARPESAEIGQLTSKVVGSPRTTGPRAVKFEGK
jgi:hypothetical protein